MIFVLLKHEKQITTMPEVIIEISNNHLVKS